MKRILIIAALVATIAVPFALRPRQAAGLRETDDTLVIVSPHNGAIRREFETGFQQWYLARTGRTVAVDWRIVGGTSDIDRFLEGQYTASFRILWTEGLGRPWSAAVEAGFQNGSLPADAPALVRQARAAFLQSDAGCGIDLFFGGGAYDFGKQAAAGRVVDSGVRKRHPEWFTDATFPELYGGERYRDQEDRWFGTTLSSFGIIYNRQALARLGVARPLEQWGDLADPRLAGALALCDPTKSGSMAYAFENMIQQQIARRWEALGGGGGKPGGKGGEGRLD